MGADKIIGTSVSAISKIGNTAIGDIASITGQTVSTFTNTYSLDFDGVDDYVNCNRVQDLEIQALSWSIWSKPAGYTRNTCIFMKGSSSNRGLAMWITSSDVLICQAGNFTNDSYFGSQVASLPTYIPVDTWGHIAFTHEQTATGATQKIYINGTLRNTYTSTTNPYTISYPGNNLYLGQRNNNGYRYIGKMDEVSFWNSALSSGDVSTLWNEGTPNNLNTALATTPVAYWRMGDSGLFFNGNWEIPSQPQIDNFSSHSMAFDGVDNHVRIGPAATSLGISGAITISMWCKMPAGATAVGPVILGEDSESGSPANLLRNWSFILVFDNLIFELFNTGGGASQQCTDPVNSRIQDGNWHHVMGTYSGTNDADGQKLYIDGVLVDSNTTAGTGTNTGAQSLFIGGAGITGTSYNWNGNIDDVAVFNTDKSGSIATIYNSGVPTDLSAESGLYGYWKMGEDATWDGSDWTIPDASTNSNDGTSSGMAEEDKINNAPGNINQGLSSGMVEADRETDVP